MNFLESIKLKDAKFHLIDYHQDRIDRTAHQYGFSVQNWRLKHELEQLDIPKDGLYKVRLAYNQLNREIDIQAYQIRPIRSFSLVYDDEIDYAFKYTDRNQLTKLFSQRVAADDIIIVKNGLVTDSYYANLAFLKAGVWYTPRLPLLAGTKRQYYLDSGRLVPIDIAAEEIKDFEKIRMINAMIDLEDKVGGEYLSACTKII